MWENIVEPDRPQMTVWLLRMHAGNLRPLDTHSEYVILNCFSTTTVLARTRLSVMLYVRTLPVVLFCAIRDLSENNRGQLGTVVDRYGLQEIIGLNFRFGEEINFMYLPGIEPWIVHSAA